MLPLLRGPSKAKSTPDSLFALLPSGPGRATPKYAAHVFGYSFLSDVFMADYEEGGVTWRDSFGPTATPKRLGPFSTSMWKGPSATRRRSKRSKRKGLIA